MYPKQQVFFIGHLSSLKIPWFCWCLRHSFESLLQVLAPAQTTPGNTRRSGIFGSFTSFKLLRRRKACKRAYKQDHLGWTRWLWLHCWTNIKDQPRSANLSNLLPMCEPNKTKQIEAFFEWFLPPPPPTFGICSFLFQYFWWEALVTGKLHTHVSLEMALCKTLLGGPKVMQAN